MPKNPDNAEETKTDYPTTRLEPMWAARRRDGVQVRRMFTLESHLAAMYNAMDKDELEDMVSLALLERAKGAVEANSSLEQVPF